jgi:hypothetical protein
VQPAFEQIGSPLVTNVEPAKAEQPGKRALDHAAVVPESLGGGDPATRDPRRDATSPEGAAQGRGVVRLVGVQFGRTLAQLSWSATGSDDRGNRVDQGEQLGGVMSVGGRKPDGEWGAVVIDNQVVLGARLTAIDRVRAGLQAPLLARTLRLSTLALDQSMAASSPSQFSSVSCNRCQPRNRRQQVVPLPQPSSLGAAATGTQSSARR